MLQILVFGLSTLVLAASSLAAGHGTPPAIPHPSFSAEYAQHAAAEHADVPPPAPPAAPAPSVQDIIRDAFNPLGPGAVSWAEQIAYCESRYDPNAVNSESDAEGLFQFLPSTWAGTPFAGASPFDPAANAHAAAWLLQTYGAGQWACQAG